MPQQSSPTSRDEEGQLVAVKDRRRRRVAFEETARDTRRYLENRKDLKVSITELEEQLGMSEAGKKRDWPTFFEIFTQGEEEVCIASWARWNAQLKGLVELEKGVRI